ncbi:ATP synthase F0 subunit A [Colwellia sp. MT41]|uniref:NnrS family protein n=1 Tax=Colwellia sp. MT41 TaxID=58049 RepID=UPI0007178629|nr:NnrS family protein [Colwellia sp. MT41]ALO33839.1 ATP synthase F0 subunit A [Colwellia sp. MT41]
MLQNQDSPRSQLTYEQQEPSALTYLVQHPLLDLPFRSFFLLAVACSMFSLGIWAGYFNGYFTFVGNGISPLAWHIHEMIFGFGATVAVGFILTAAQTWTGQPSIKGLPVLAFFTLWLLVRVALVINLPSTIIIAMVLQSFWWLGAIFVFTGLVVKSSNRRNYLFIPLLAVLMLLNIALLLLDFYGEHQLTRHIASTSVLMFCLLMGILAGRVIPFFTVSGAKLAPIKSPRWLTTLLTITAILAVLVFFSSAFIDLPFSPAGLMITAGLLHLIRQCYWRSFATRNIALLWSLHLSYFSLGLGLILMGMSYLPAGGTGFIQLAIPFGDALHMITIAAMGLMIFAMMSRVSLGHTGRALTPSKLVSWIFFLIMISALARVILPSLSFLPILVNQTLVAWNISALAWLIAGILFLKVYLAILTTKKLPKITPQDKDG